VVVLIKIVGGVDVLVVVMVSVVAFILVFQEIKRKVVHTDFMCSEYCLYIGWRIHP